MLFKVAKYIVDSVYAAWAWFEEQVNAILPGFKSLIINGLTFVGTTATAAAAYMQNVPLDQFVNAKTLAIVLLVVTTLSFWLRNIGERVEERA